MSKSGDFASFNAIDFINRRKKMTEVGGIAVDRLRKMDAADRDEKELLLETYRKALEI